MEINFDTEKIDAVLYDFYRATGARILLYDENFIPISYSRHELCSYCRSIQKSLHSKKECISFDTELMQRCKNERVTVSEMCPFGLLNTVFPLEINGNIVCYLFYGQMKTDESFPPPCFSDNNRILNDPNFKNYYKMLPLFTTKRIEGVSNLSQMLIKFLLTENLLSVNTEETVEKCMEYISEHLGEDLSIARLSREINVSKTVLYGKFRSRLNLTIGEYINQERIKRAKELLLNTKLTVEEISGQIGFASASYFTKNFREQVGVTPLKFRKKHIG